jgi:hypothetical protein
MTSSTTEVTLAENEVGRKQTGFTMACRAEERARLEMMRAIATAIQAHEITAAKVAIAGERLERAERKLDAARAIAGK